MNRRPLLLLCLIPAVLMTGAPVALAGDDDTQTVTVEAPAPPPQTVTVETPPTTVTTPAPPPVTVTTPAAETPSSGSGGSGAVKGAVHHAKKKVVHSTFVAKPSPAAVTPVGAVQAGGGGTAPRADGTVLPALAMGGGGLLLLGLGWRLVPGRKRLGS